MRYAPRLVVIAIVSGLFNLSFLLLLNDPNQSGGKKLHKPASALATLKSGLFAKLAGGKGSASLQSSDEERPLAPFIQSFIRQSLISLLHCRAFNLYLASHRTIWSSVSAV